MFRSILFIAKKNVLKCCLFRVLILNMGTNNALKLNEVHQIYEEKGDESKIIFLNNFSFNFRLIVKKNNK